MKSKEVLRSLEALRDPRVDIARSFLRKRGLDLAGNPDAVWSRCLSEAEGNNPEAQYVLFTLLLTGVLGRQDEGSAVSCCRKAAEVGYMPAIDSLGKLYISGGTSVPKDPVQGFDLLIRASGAGYPPASISLAMAYLHGFHVPQDRARGISLLRQAAESGDTMAQFHLGDELVESQDSVEQTEGVKWLEAAANRGLHVAHLALALLYQAGGGGLAANPQLAEHHLQLGQKLQDEWHRRIGF